MSKDNRAEFDRLAMAYAFAFEDIRRASVEHHKVVNGQTNIVKPDQVHESDHCRNLAQNDLKVFD